MLKKQTYRENPIVCTFSICFVSLFYLFCICFVSSMYFPVISTSPDRPTQILCVELSCPSLRRPCQDGKQFPRATAGEENLRKSTQKQRKNYEKQWKRKKTKEQRKTTRPLQQAKIQSVFYCIQSNSRRVHGVFYRIQGNSRPTKNNQKQKSSRIRNVFYRIPRHMERRLFVHVSAKPNAYLYGGPQSLCQVWWQ